MAHPGGRPTKMTDETVKKLEEAFLLGCSDLEACFYAEISKQTLYNYQDKFPKFVDRKEQLKQNPFLIARKSVIEGMEEDPKLALAYLERKKKGEFSLRTETAVKLTDEFENMTDEELDNAISSLKQGIDE
jgi:hypothetical protein